jgi:hypothetical protein
VKNDSIREKINSAKEDDEALLKSKEVSPEIAEFIKSLILVIDVISVVFLEKKTRRNSSNSGLPPSQNKGSNGNPNTDKGQRGGLGQSTSNVQHSETSEITTPESCSKCLEDLTNVNLTGKYERQKIDILYKVVTHTVVTEIKVCPICGTFKKGGFPDGMDRKVQYGDTVKAMIINFLSVKMILQRLQEHMMSIMGRSLSKAIMLK